MGAADSAYRAAQNWCDAIDKAQSLGVATVDKDLASTAQSWCDTLGSAPQTQAWINQASDTAQVYLTALYADGPTPADPSVAPALSTLRGVLGQFAVACQAQAAGGGGDFSAIPLGATLSAEMQYADSPANSDAAFTASLDNAQNVVIKAVAIPAAVAVAGIAAASGPGLAGAAGGAVVDAAANAAKKVVVGLVLLVLVVAWIRG